MDKIEADKIMAENAELKKLLEKPQKDPKKDFEKYVLGVALNDKIEFEVLIDERNFFHRLMGKKSKIYYVREHVNLNKTIRIAQKLLEIPKFVFEGKSDSELLQQNIETVAKYKDKIVIMIGILFNTKNYKFLEKNLDDTSMFKIVTIMFKMVGDINFMNTIGLLRSKTSLKSE